MIALITDNHYVYLGQVTSGVEDIISRWFSAKDKKSRYINTNQNWDGVYRRYNTNKQRLSIAFLNELKLCCNKNNIPLDIIDNRNAPKYPSPNKEHITKDFIDSITLYNYQVEPLKICCDEDIGCIEMVTGSGKTFIIAGLIKMFRCPSLIITDQKVVLDQIVKCLELSNVVYNNDIGLFCQGNLPNNNLVMVGSIQSISSPNKPKKTDIKVTRNKLIKYCEDLVNKQDVSTLSEMLPNSIYSVMLNDISVCKLLDGKILHIINNHYINTKYELLLKSYKTRLQHSNIIQEQASKCDLIVIDECDVVATTNQCRHLLNNVFSGRRRYGLSGTIENNDDAVSTLFLKESLGSVLYKVNRTDVENVGQIIPIKYYMIEHGNNVKPDSSTFDIAVKDYIINDKTLHNKILTIVNNFDSDEGTLILIDTSPIEDLGYTLEELIPDSKFIYGKTSSKERWACIKDFQDRKIKCLIGSKIIYRGLDLKGGCENCILVGSLPKHKEFLQKIGRAVRKNKLGYSRVFDFYYVNNKYLLRHSQSRLKAAVNEGITITVLINGQELEGSKFVKSRFRRPR